jgi:hypothetical protein
MQQMAPGFVVAPPCHGRGHGQQGRRDDDQQPGHCAKATAANGKADDCRAGAEHVDDDGARPPPPDPLRQGDGAAGRLQENAALFAYLVEAGGVDFEMS